MTKAARPDEFPVHSPESLPRHVRVLLAQHGRAVAALRVYRRRGWNDRALVRDVEDKRQRLSLAFDAIEHHEVNPRLF